MKALGRHADQAVGFYFEAASLDQHTCFPLMDAVIVFLPVTMPWMEPVLRLMGFSVQPNEAVDFFRDLIMGIINERRADPNKEVSHIAHNSV